MDGQELLVLFQRGNELSKRRCAQVHDKAYTGSAFADVDLNKRRVAVPDWFGGVMESCRGDHRSMRSFA